MKFLKTYTRPRTKPPKVLYLAVADGRGHLMRAVMISQLLEELGSTCEVVTTDNEGVEFLKSFGIEAKYLKNSYLNVFDDLQNLSIKGTENEIIKYLLSPSRGLKDAANLIYSDADVVFNDCLHISGLISSLLGKPTINIMPSHILDVVKGRLDKRPPLNKLLDFVLDRATTNVHIGLLNKSLTEGWAIKGKPSKPTDYYIGQLLPQIKPMSEITGQKTQNAVPTAVVYLNPMFHDVDLGTVLQCALRQAGYHVHCVGEGMKSIGWIPSEPDLPSWVAAADLVISAPGMGMLSQVHAYDKKYIALVSNQPEQVDNLSDLNHIDLHYPQFNVNTPKSEWNTKLKDLVSTEAKLLEKESSKATQLTIKIDVAHSRREDWKLMLAQISRSLD